MITNVEVTTPTQKQCADWQKLIESTSWCNKRCEAKHNPKNEERTP
jgi:hypothetical protein